MAVSSSSLSALRFSLKKVLLEWTANTGIEIVFDRSLAQPNLRDASIDKWIVPVYGYTRYMDSAIQFELNINVCTRRDPEWDNNAQVLDIIKHHFEDARAIGGNPIPFIENNEHVGDITVLTVEVRRGYDLEDQTKITPMSVVMWCPIRYQ